MHAMSLSSQNFFNKARNLNLLYKHWFVNEKILRKTVKLLFLCHIKAKSHLSCCLFLSIWTKFKESFSTFVRVREGMVLLLQTHPLSQHLSLRCANRKLLVPWTFVFWSSISDLFVYHNMSLFLRD